MTRLRWKYVQGRKAAWGIVVQLYFGHMHSVSCRYRQDGEKAYS